MSQIKDNILNCIHDNGSATTKQLTNLLNLSSAQVYNAVHRLKRQGVLIKEGSGAWQISSNYKFEPVKSPVVKVGKNLIEDLQMMLNDVDKYKIALRKIDTALTEAGL